MAEAVDCESRYVSTSALPSETLVQRMPSMRRCCLAAWHQVPSARAACTAVPALSPRSPYAAPALHVLVRAMTGRVLSMRVGEGAVTLDLAAAVEAAEAVPTEQQRLFLEVTEQQRLFLEVTEQQQLFLEALGKEQQRLFLETLGKAARW